MPNSTSDGADDFGVPLEEFIAVKQRMSHLALENTNLIQACQHLESKNAKLYEMLDTLASIVEKKFDKKKQQKLASSYAALPKPDFVYNIDVVGACSVKCPSCPVGNATSHPTKGFMDIGTYTKILEKIAEENKGKTVYIELYNWGESVLHPKLPDIIRLTKGFGFVCGMSNNLNTVIDLRGVVRAEPDYMRISISGFTNESYQRTHSGGDVNAVKSNLYLLRHNLDKYKNTRTRVEIGYLVYRHNFEADLLQMRALCDELSFSLNWNYAILMPVESAIDAAQGKVPENVRAITDLLIVSPQKWSELSKPYRAEHKECVMHETRTVINYDGSVPLCCGTYTPETVIAESFLETSHEEIQARKHSHSLCKACMANMVDFMFTCIKPKEVDDYAKSELSRLGVFIGHDGR